MIATISETIKISVNDNRFAIQEIDEFEDKKTTLKIYSKEDAIALAKALTEWGESLTEADKRLIDAQNSF
jgi:hypothetical protein